MTVCDSYDALGLVATLKPNESGGTEHNQYGRLEDETGPSTSTRGDPKGIETPSAGAKIPAGYGRILRDEQGHAVDVEFGDEEGETMDTDRNVETMDDVDRAYLDEESACAWTQLGTRPATRRPNSVVQGMGRFLMKELPS
jgi:nucleolar protein 16